MTFQSARALWGSEAVRKALEEPHQEEVTAALAALVQAKANEFADDAPGLARWALSLPWPRFCAVVRIVSGDAAQDLLEGQE